MPASRTPCLRWSVSTPDTRADGTPHTVSVAAPDVESLLVDWLE
ncbi:MAG: hypothetical protein R2838_18800 [Caldilineaceae bacterium]